MEIFSLDFMVRALIAGTLTGMLAPAVGTFIVQRRLSLLGDGLGHVAIAGVGLALLTGAAPLPIAMLFCLVGSLIIEALRQSGRAAGDVGLAILFYGGLAAGVLMAGMSGTGSSPLNQYLFGSLTSVDKSDLVVVLILAIVVIAVVLGLAPQLFAVSIDPDFAKTQGLKVGFLNFVVMVLAAMTVALSMRTVGVLLVSALLVVPVTTANNLVAGFYRALWLAITIGTAVAICGVIGSYYLNSPSGPTIVVLAILLFVLTLPLKPMMNRRRRKSAIQESGPIVHKPAELSAGEPMPSEAILHGDHVDYLQGRHRHAPHGDHYDEH